MSVENLVFPMHTKSKQEYKWTNKLQARKREHGRNVVLQELRYNWKIILNMNEKIAFEWTTYLEFVSSKWCSSKQDLIVLYIKTCKVVGQTLDRTVFPCYCKLRWMCSHGSGFTIASSSKLKTTIFKLPIFSN